MLGVRLLHIYLNLMELCNCNRINHKSVPAWLEVAFCQTVWK